MCGISPLRDWDRFWFAPQTTRALSIYRIGLGLLVLIDAARKAPWLEMFFADRGLFTVDSLVEYGGYTPTGLLVFGSDAACVYLLFALYILAATAFTAGWATRATGIALFVLAASFHTRNPLIVNSGNSAIMAMLFLFMFAPRDQFYSVDRWLRSRRGDDVGTGFCAPWVQRTMQCQVALLWLMAGYFKAHGTLWYTGSAMYYIFGQVDFTVRGVETLMNYPVVYTTLTLATVFAELAIPFLLWSRKARPYAVAMIVGIQGWIVLFMTLPVFPLFTLLSTILFVDEDQLSRRRVPLESNPLRG